MTSSVRLDQPAGVTAYRSTRISARIPARIQARDDSR
jgi:hypothetical protein